jgi:hypothetical protein
VPQGDIVTDLLRENATLLLTAAVMIGVWWLLRTKGARFASTQSFDRLTASRAPLVLEFFSNT